MARSASYRSAVDARRATRKAAQEAARRRESAYVNGDFMLDAQIRSLATNIDQASRLHARIGGETGANAITTARERLAVLQTGDSPFRRDTYGGTAEASIKDVQRAREALRTAIEKMQGMIAKARSKGGEGMIRGEQTVAPWVQPAGETGYRITDDGRCRSPRGPFAKREACGLAPAPERKPCHDAAGRYIPGCGRRGGVHGIDGFDEGFGGTAPARTVPDLPGWAVGSVVAGQPWEFYWWHYRLERKPMEDHVPGAAPGSRIGWRVLHSTAMQKRINPWGMERIGWAPTIEEAIAVVRRHFALRYPRGRMQDKPAGLPLWIGW